jgi:glycosyltransferase involved in cell wall biosynthesis
MSGNGSRPPRVALVSVGLGRIQRGFERYFSDLFEVLRDHLDVTLFKTGGESVDHQRVPPLFRVAQKMARLMPFGKFGDGTEYPKYKHDCAALGLSLAPELIRGRFDVIHFIDPPMAKVFRHLKRVLRLRSEIVFTNGCNFPPQYYPAGMHIQHVAQPLFEEALELGVEKRRMTLAPCGIHTDRFMVSEERETVRRRHGIAAGTFVVLAVTAVKRVHKRVDHIVDEVATLGGDILLWIDGSPEDSSLIEEARRKLGERVRITHVPTAQVPELYAAADVFVHAALLESFGLAIVEAMSAGLPVVVHDSPHFRWLAGGPDALVDMTRPGALARRIEEIRSASDRTAQAAARARAVRERFDWKAVAPNYVHMYQSVAGRRLTISS